MHKSLSLAIALAFLAPSLADAAPPSLDLPGGIDLDELGKQYAKKGKKKSSAPEPREDSLGGLVARIRSLYNSKAAKLPRVLGACALLVGIVYGYVMFYQYSHYMAKAISQPMVMFQARTQNSNFELEFDRIDSNGELVQQ